MAFSQGARPAVLAAQRRSYSWSASKVSMVRRRLQMLADMTQLFKVNRPAAT
jgi:hypothetical protein